MWRKLSLRRRLNLMFAALLMVWLAADISRILASAGPRVQAEERSMSRITQEFVQSSLAGMQQSADPESDLGDLVKSLQFLRHVRVGLGPGALPSILGPGADAHSDAPAWFRALVRAPTQVALIPALIKGRNYGSIAILANPAEEIDEVWSQARGEVAGVCALAIVALIGTSLFLRRSLRPLDIAGATLARLEAGDYHARATTEGAPEFVALSTRINRLGEALGQLHADNQSLLMRVIDAHEAERRAIARDLHDEIGPHLFALRANAAALASRLGETGDAVAIEAARTIGAETEALQQQNRRILADLRPASLEELGLAAALQSLVERWRRAAPDVEIALEIGAEAEAIAPKAALTVYRVAQEALTNAFRHSGARRVSVRLGREPARAASGDDSPLAGLGLDVADDGRGLPEPPSEGAGLIGMRERVRALGGTFTVRSNPGGGTIVEARFGA